MGFRTGSYAKVWEVKPVGDKVTELRISISRKAKDSDEYEQDFGGYVRCVGAQCASEAARLTEGARIRIGDVDVTRRYDKEAKKEYTNFTIFSFEDADAAPAPKSTGSGASVGAKAPKDEVDSGEVTDNGDDLPW